MAIKDSYYTVSQAAKELGVTRQSISRWLNTGVLSAEKVGREKLIPKIDVYRFSLGRDAIRFVPRMWDALEKFLHHHIEKIILEPFPIPEMEFTRAMVFSTAGKVDYVAIWDKERIGEKDSYQFNKIKKFDWSREDMQPYIEMYIGVTKGGRVIATYRRGDNILK